MTSTSPVFSPWEIPFSCSGSWFNFSPFVAVNRSEQDIHLVSHQAGIQPVLRLQVAAEANVSATPQQLTWSTSDKRIDLVYESADTVRLRGQGLGLRLLAADRELTPFTGMYFYRDPATNGFVFTFYQTGRRYRVTVLAGAAEVLGDQELGIAERGLVLPADPWEIVIEEYETARVPYVCGLGFNEVVRQARAGFDEFLEAVAPWRTERTGAAELAAYVLWSATAGPGGVLRRPAVLMSKHWMDRVWSWDHCFNAIALADGLPGLAADQFFLPFDHQDPLGALPDSVGHSDVLHNFVKPPIHGWAVGHHLAPLLGPADTYQALEKWTSFWLDARRAPGHELAHYQHGNDSGWDNATTFDNERVVETADLAAFLIIQMRELARLARELGDENAAEDWYARANRMRDAMIAELWDGECFLARGVFSGRKFRSTSLLDLLPIVLGEDLPQSIRDALVDRIKEHLTEFGLATEPLSSRHYESDGYWRGPIWAPTTVLVEDGLRRAGCTELADEISTRFQRLCETNGFAENFDASTGAGLRDRAYTWTASSYLILAAADQRRHAV